MPIVEVRKGEELDKSSLKRYLYHNELITDVQSDIDIYQFSVGASNLTYLIQIEDKELVLRRPPKGAIKRGHDMGREYKVLSGLGNGFDKAPKAYAYTEDESIIGASFYIMEKVEGIIIDNEVARERKISSTEFPTIANCWLDTMVELHQLSYDSLGLSDLGRPVGYVERQVRNWTKQYLKATTEEIPEALKVMAWLEEHQPRQYDHCLIHNDYKYDNVVFEDDSWERITAVLDWEMCTLGDPFMDLGAAIAYWVTADDDPMIRMVFPYPTMLEGNPSRSDIVHKYSLKSGRSINHLVFYYAFGLFKNAVIVQQIYYRYHKGLTTNEKFANLNHLTRLFFQLAWRAIQKKKIE